MGLLAVCLVSSFLPQGPSTDLIVSPPTVAVHPAAWLPADSTVALLLAPSAASWLLKDPLRGLEAHDPTGTLAQITDGLHAQLQANGLTRIDAEDLLRGGLAVGVHGTAEDGQPAITVVGRCQARADVLRHVLHTRGRALRLDAIECYELTSGSFTWVGGVFGQHLVLTTARATLQGTVAATRADQPGTLEHASDYAAALGETGNRALDLHVFLRPAGLVAALAQQTATTGMKFERMAAALELDRVQHVLIGCARIGASTQIVGTVHAPGVQGVLATLGGSPERFDANLAKVVPASASNFGLFTLDLAGLVRTALAATAAIDKNTSDMAHAAIAAWGQEHGADLISDLLAGCSGRIAAMQLPTGNALAFGAKNAAAWHGLAGKLLTGMGQTVTTRDVAGMQVHCVDMPFGATTFVGAVGGWFCVAEGEGAWSALRSQIERGEVAASVAAAMAAAPEKTAHMIAQGNSQAALSWQRTTDGMRLQSQRDDRDAAVAELTGTADPEAVRALHAAEAAGADVELQTLQTLVESTDLTVALRATWLLGKHASKDRLPLLQTLARTGATAAIRLQAMTAIAAAPAPGSLETAADALDDSDSRVRTAAAQLLGKMRRPAGKEPLLAFLQRSRRGPTGNRDTSDLQAALVALHDLGAKDELLPATATVRDINQPGIGQALAFYWQGVSPQFAREQETTLLLAALDHNELLLRRYAIDRLGELKCTSAVSALEKRLAAEGPELRPLVESTLSYLRRDQEQPKSDEVERALDNAGAMWAKATAAWRNLSSQEQLIYGGGAGGMVFFLLVGAMLVRRSRRRREQAEYAAAAASLAAPSDDYYDEQGEYDDEAVEGEYYEEGDEVYEDAEYEDAGSPR